MALRVFVWNRGVFDQPLFRVSRVHSTDGVVLDDDNGSNATDGRQHGWPCFASDAIAAFFLSFP